MALNLLGQLWKVKGANNFHFPVDPVKLGIPDYLDVIKKPMDFGTVKRKLTLNVYQTVHEFLNDMDLVFANCRTYNGTESQFGKIGFSVQMEYEKLVKNLGLLTRFSGVEEQSRFMLDNASAEQ